MVSAQAGRPATRRLAQPRHDHHDTQEGPGNMTSYQCECLFTTSEKADFIDHLLEVFDPGSSDLGTDGQVHAELTGPGPLERPSPYGGPAWFGAAAHQGDALASITPIRVGLVRTGGSHSVVSAETATRVAPDPGQDPEQAGLAIAADFIRRRDAARSAQDTEPA